MPTSPIIRSICLFSREPKASHFKRLETLKALLEDNGYLVQTLRLCTQDYPLGKLDQLAPDNSYFLGAGKFTPSALNKEIFQDFLNGGNISLHLEMDDAVSLAQVEWLFRIIDNRPAKTFNFCYSFGTAPGSPFFPSSQYFAEGFSVGLQPTNLSKGCQTHQEWLEKMKDTWLHLTKILADEKDFLGIDSSIAPLYEGEGSFMGIATQWVGGFPEVVTSDIFLKTSAFIKTENPKPVGLCGLMFPCLEDFYLAEAYEAGEFTLERNLFLSLHSGLGIDTYPIGIDEKPERVLQILEVLRKLSQKYNKPLSARFVSDGSAHIGELSDFQNPYLKDVIIRPL